MSQKRNKGKMDSIANEINIIKSSQAKKQNRLDEVIQKQDEILDRYQCTEVTELRRLKDKVLHRNVLHEENKKRYKKALGDLEKLELDKREKQEKLIYYVNLMLDSNRLDINNINLVKEKCEIFKDTKKNINHKNEDKKNRLEKYNTISERLSILNKAIDEVADKYKVRDEKELQLIKDSKYLYHSILDTINNKKELLDRLLGDNTLEDLEQKLKKYDKEYITTEKSKEELLLEQDNLINDILHISKDITSYETKIANIQKDVRPIVDIEGDISNKLNIKSEYDKKIKALTMARDAIENISRDIQNNFAPKLNEKVSKIIGNITNRKYTDIKINPNMEILTYEPENHELISINSLSKGTIDQMYFGLRLGLIDIIKEDKKLPLVLDDCFVQYDNNRLKMVMETLGNLNRQIIILSCHRREERILRDINIDFNYIAL
jgi:uncharacterized protein YhaN